MYVLNISGPPRERGLQHGNQFKTQIHELAEIRKALLISYMKPLSMDEMNEIVQKQIDSFKSHRDPIAQKYWEEFAGIADGAQISHLDLMILNNYTDLRDFGYSKSQHDEGCSVFGYESAHAHYCGQTWDMHASARPYMLHLKTAENAHILTVTGCLGLAGVNRQGVAVMVNNLHCKETQYQLPWPGLIRGIMDQSSARTALTYLSQNLPSSGHNYLICDTQDFIDVETTGERYAIAHQSSKSGGAIPRYTWHTNHYITELKAIEIAERKSPTTQKRFEEVEKKLKSFARNPNLKTQDMVEELFGEPIICMPKPTHSGDGVEAGPHAGMTCGGLWVDFVSRRARFFAGTYDEKDHSDFQIG